MVGTLTGFDDSGARITIPSDPGGRPTVLYVFSQSCVWCERSIPALRTLIPRNARHLRFIAVDLSAPFAPSKPYLSDRNLTFDECFHPDPETRARIGVQGTPTTLVIDASGTVEKVFNGALIGTTLQSANEYFAVAPTDQPTAQAALSVPHVYNKGCIQDGLQFSFDALVCWQGRVYDCARGAGWKEVASACPAGGYLARSRPIP